MERIILVRHGQTKKNKVGIIHSFGDEELLNETGIDQIKKTASKLEEFSPVKVFSSQGKRATQSGDLIAQNLKVKLEVIRGLEERNWGDFSGRTWEEVAKVLDPMTLDQRYNYIPPNGESWKEFETRLIKTINKILAENKEATTVVVSHGGAIRALMPYFLNMPGDESFKYKPDNASITIFDHKEGKFTKIIVNDTQHLL